MRIVFVTRRYPPLIGGAEIAIARLAQGLAERGHGVRVITQQIPQAAINAGGPPNRENVPSLPNGPSPPSPSPTDAWPKGLEVIRLAAPRIRFWGTARWMAKLRWWLNRLAAAADVFYVSMLKHEAYVAVGVGKRHGIPVVLRPSGTGPSGDIAWQNRSLLGHAIRRRCQEADAFVAVSEPISEELVQAGYPRDRINSICGGVPIPPLPYNPQEVREHRRRLCIEALPEHEGFLAVSVGRLSPEKGLDTLIESLGLLIRRYPSAHLLLIGQGPQRPELERKTHQMGLQASVHFYGETPQVEPLLRAADVFALPSWQEGMSNALLEAMALGLAVVASDIPGNRAVIQHGTTGWLAAAGHPEAWADAMEQIAGNEALRQSLGAAARRHATDRFSLERVVTSHEELFARLVQDRRSET